MARRKTRTLTEVELEFMQAVWAADREVTTEDVLDALRRQGRELAGGSVRKVLSILLLAAGGLAALLRRRQASVRCVIWTAALLAVPLLPLMGWALSRVEAPRAEIPVMPAYAATPAPPAGDPQAAASRPAAVTLVAMARVEIAAGRQWAGKLKADIDRFRLSVWLCDERNAEHHNLTLHVPAAPPAPVCPFCGFRKPPHKLLSARIDAKQAAKIIDHLAAEGFLDRCRNVAGMPMEPTAFPGLVLKAFGPDGTTLFDEVHKPQQMRQRLEALRRVVAGDAVKAIDKLIAVLAALLPGPATQPATASTEAPEVRIARLIAQLGSEEHAKRAAAQEALVQIGLPAIRALEAAGSDGGAERAARAQAALRQIKERVRLKKKTWRNRWERMSLSIRLSTPPSRGSVMGLDVDPRGKAVATFWDARRNAPVRYESVLARKDLDSLARRLGLQRPWELCDVPKLESPAQGSITLRIAVEDEFVHIEQPWPPPRGLPLTRENAQLVQALMAIQNEMAHVAEVVRRDAAIRAAGGAAGRGAEGKEASSTDTERGGERTALRKVLDLLDLPWQTRLTPEQLDESAASIRPNADEAVEAILKQYNQRSSNAFRHRAVQVFQRLGTAKARAALLDIALGRTADDLPSSRAWAARAYLETIADKADARRLLASNEPQVLNSALLAIKGLPVDAPLLKRIGEIVQRKEEYPAGWMALRLAAADVVSGDARSVLLAERVDLILAVLSDVAKMPERDKVYWPGNMTHAEAAYARLLLNLVNMPADAGAFLEKACAARRGVERDVLIIARASRGDATVREDIRAILAEEKAGLRRAWAARGLGVIGSAEDLPLLKRLAETDPLAREMGGEVGPPGFRQAKFFPVRNAAKEASQAIEREAAAAATQPATQPARGAAGRRRRPNIVFQGLDKQIMSWGPQLHQRGREIQEEVGLRFPTLDELERDEEAREDCDVALAQRGRAA
jgi:hypothetical protein